MKTVDGEPFVPNTSERQLPSIACADGQSQEHLPLTTTPMNAQEQSYAHGQRLCLPFSQHQRYPQRLIYRYLATDSVNTSYARAPDDLQSSHPHALETKSFVYIRMQTKTNIRTVNRTVTAIAVFAVDSGFTRFCSTPGGGSCNATLERSVPGGKFARSGIMIVALERFHRGYSKCERHCLYM